MTDSKPPFVCYVYEGFSDAVYIGQAEPRWGKLKESKWANPFKTTDYVDCIDVVRQYEAFLRRPMQQYLRNQLDELTGKPLACWCRRSNEPRTDQNTCHGDVLVKLWKERNQ